MISLTSHRNVFSMDVWVGHWKTIIAISTRFRTRQPSFNNYVLLIRLHHPHPCRHTPSWHVRGRGASSALIAGAWPCVIACTSCTGTIYQLFKPSNSLNILTLLEITHWLRSAAYFLSHKSNKCYFRQNTCIVYLRVINCTMKWHKLSRTLCCF